MDLFFHLAIHVATSLLAGYIVWKIWGKPVAAFGMAFLGGVLIDLDHWIDYWLAFGWRFNLGYFIQGYQFLKSNKIYILLHGWEYAIILMIVAVILKKNTKLKKILLALGISMTFHLGADLFLNDGAKIGTYSAIYRWKSGFELKALVTPEHYQDHQMRKKLMKFEY